MSLKSMDILTQYKTILISYFRMAARSYMELDEDGEFIVNRKNQMLAQMLAFIQALLPINVP